jgi:hypothetical protein
MKQRLFFVTCCAILVAVGGCGKASHSTYPPTSGDFVKNENGHGAAKVWGIAFDVTDVAGGGSSSHFTGSLNSDPEKTDARNDFSMGDVRIRLEKVPGKPLSIRLNDKEYGALNIGDKVSIDKERKMKVNDSLRASK